jgi:integral membrane protein
MASTFDSTSSADAIRRLRLVGLLEGGSLLVLVLIAMPLKYLFAYPLAVRIVGALHGLLFLWFLSVLLRTHLEEEWRVRDSAKLLAAAIVPFGFLTVEGWFRQRLR